ncbi:MAG TPA: hypothetical protein VKZ53_10830 [Candidatus Angelobacter sp.]|nr:hypothetical protein [Candidatus Angelobacter sp.]
MTPREQIRRLAQFESDSECAVSFYFQPQKPRNNSHREEAIQVKDLVKECLRRAERNGQRQGLRADLERVLEAAGQLRGNHSRGKAIFACGEKGIWREMDIPPQLDRSSLVVSSRFHLKPLVAAYSDSLRTCIALIDRERARIFTLMEGELIPKPDLYLGSLPNLGRSDGFAGYDGGHRERHVENEVMHHFKQLGESLRMLFHLDRFEALLIGCRDETWPEIEPHLGSDMRQRLIGRLQLDPGVAPAEEVRSQGEKVVSEFMVRERDRITREVLAEARRNGRGAVGLRHVLTALARQEVQTIVVSRHLAAEAVECTRCGHFDTRMVRRCALCRNATKDVADIADALVDLALRNGADIVFVNGDSVLEKSGRVGALLRYRADQNTPRKIAV